MFKPEMTLPPRARVVQIPRAEDNAFRKFLIDHCPEQVRHRIKDGLTNGPKPHGAAHAIRYFGADEVRAIGLRCVPLLHRLELRCPRLIAWLGASQFANDYRILKAFDEWAAIENGRDPAAQMSAPAVVVTDGQ